VSEQAKAEIEAYLKTVGPTKASALAIARDGSETARGSASYLQGGGGGGFHYALQEKANRSAITNCGGPKDCMLLYEGNRKVASVEIIVK
jgi:hypothetical protein